jgi:transcription antitermination protein NusB
MGNRRQAREIALQILYQLDVQEHLSEDQGLALFWSSFARADHEGPEADQESREFAERLVRGVLTERDKLDDIIGKASRNWRVERMARVDRNLLRLALYEMKHGGEDVPAKVAINEAIEIAKRYGTSESPAFINGVLDRCLEDFK